MRKILKLSLLTIIVFLTVTTCKKDDNDSPNVSVSSGYASAKTGSSEYIFVLDEIKRMTFGKDTVYFYIGGKNSDSTASIYIYMENMYDFKVGKYDISEEFFNDRKISVYININNEEYESYYGGTLTIYTLDDNIIKGSFSVPMYNITDTTKKDITLQGQFNGSFTGLDPSIKDIDVLPGSMEARLNDQLFYFNVIAADITIDSTRMINVTATRGDKSIVLQFINFQPWSGKTYRTGTYYSDEGGYIKASYIKDNIVPYVANEEDTLAATIKIAKISSTTIQGYFDFDAKSKNDTTLIKVRSGKFNARFRNYQ